MKTKIWFHFDNAPHVPILLPVATELERRGYEVIYSARDVSQTFDLLKMAHIQFEQFGGTFPKNSLLKLTYTLMWGIRLALKMRKHGIACAMSHSSRSAILAGWLLKIPTIAMYDYEYVNSFFQNNLASLVLMPEPVRDNGLREAGISLKNLEFYPGIKEQLYLNDTHQFNPIKATNPEQIIVTIRLPGEGHYTNVHSEQLFDLILDNVMNYDNSYVILLPRSAEQRQRIVKRLNGQLGIKVHIPEKPIPTKDLILSSDVVIGSGGTMVREAAVLGVPAYSFFLSKDGAVDKYLAQQERLIFIRNENDIRKIRIEKCREKKLLKTDVNQIDWLCNRIEKCV
ncbi:DUF354 domain-containing protein [candidate division KSB1 bacterium]|nr:DUF354 domain-containing protein [candidate division KSB1 bacterium]